MVNELQNFRLKDIKDEIHLERVLGFVKEYIFNNCFKNEIKFQFGKNNDCLYLIINCSSNQIFELNKWIDGYLDDIFFESYYEAQ